MNGFKNPNAAPFIRKGVVGGWQDLFTPEISNQFDWSISDKLKAAGLDLSFV